MFASTHSVNGPFQSLQISAPESQIRFHIVTLSPFVPGFDENQTMVRLLLRHSGQRLTNIAFEKLR